MRRLIVTDLDSTIIFDRAVSQADREAMERWRAAGNLLAIDTGKSIFAARDVLEPAGVRFDYGIVFTGAVLIDGDYQVLAARHLPDGVARAIVEDTAGLPGVTTYATTITQDYILADNNGDTSPILQVFEPMSTARMGETDVILATSTGTTFLMLASDEPRTSQLLTTSQRATQWARRSRLFAGMSSSAGTRSPRTRAMTRQKRLRGLP